MREHTIDSQVFEQRWTYYVYEPPSPPSTTLYVQGGEAFYRILRFYEVAEALTEQGLIRPVRLVMVEPHDRMSDYWFNERYEALLLREILPEVDQRYGATPEHGLWGASLGGLVSIWLAWRNPDLFTKVGSQSGCFTAHPVVQLPKSCELQGTELKQQATQDHAHQLISWGVAFC